MTEGESDLKQSFPMFQGHGLIYSRLLIPTKELDDAITSFSFGFGFRFSQRFRLSITRVTCIILLLDQHTHLISFHHHHTTHHPSSRPSFFDVKACLDDMRGLHLCRLWMQIYENAGSGMVVSCSHLSAPLSSCGNLCMRCIMGSSREKAIQLYYNKRHAGISRLRSRRNGIIKRAYLIIFAELHTHQLLAILSVPQSAASHINSLCVIKNAFSSCSNSAF